MRRITRRTKLVLGATLLILATAGITYALVAQVLKDVPGVANFVAGIELDSANLDSLVKSLCRSN